MSDAPTSAKCVVIGAGIVGNCLVGHLTKLGWNDLVLVDKGPLPNPGGSTGHASNFIFPVDHNKEMCLLGVQSANQYRDLGLSVDSGGIEVARTPERMDELQRRMTSATAWGVEARLLTPDEVGEICPFINTDIVLGGFYCPTVSVVDSLETGTVMRRLAVDNGCRVLANTEVLDIVTEPGPNPGDRTVKAVVTSAGTIEAEYVVIACGVWSNRLANMAGAYIPLVPAVHQMADVGPIDILAETGNEIGYPIVRDMDTFCYERQTAGSMEVGSYAHRPIFHHPDEIPSNEEAALSPTEMPFTADDFDPQMEQAIELMDMLGDAEIKYAINGLLSLTPDAMPCLGEVPEVRNLWSAAAVWVKEGPGMAQVVAEWMTFGYPRVIDVHGADIARFYPEERPDEHIWDRSAEHFNKTYGIVHPAEQWESRRNLRVGPYFSRQEDLGSVFFQARTWERPQWFESNADLVERYGVEDREVEWDARWWSPITIAEHLNLRENCGLVDLSAFQIYELTGPGAVAYADRLAVNKIDVPVGRSIYTPWLTPDGGFHSDLTMMRLGEDRVRVVTGVFDGGRDEFWARRHLPTDGSVSFANVTDRITTLGLWGPNAPAVLSALCDADLSQAGSSYGSLIDVELDCGAGGRSGGGHAVPHLLCGRHRLGDLPGLGRRPGGVGRPDAGRRRLRPAGHRRRGVRHLGPAGEGLPPDGRRAGERVQPAGGRPGPAPGEGRRLHRQGGLPGGPRGRRARGADVRAHGGGPARRPGPQALHAGRQRAHPHPRRRPHRGLPRPDLAGHDRRPRPVGGQAPADGLPADRTGRGGHRPAGDVHERAVRCAGGRHRCGVRSRRLPDEELRRTDRTDRTDGRLGRTPGTTRLRGGGRCGSCAA